MRITRVYDDHHRFGFFTQPPFDLLEDDRMRIGHVAACNQKTITAVNIFVAGGWAVAAEHAAIGRGSAGHTQPAVAVDMIRTDIPLEKLVAEVPCLCIQLSRAIQRDGIRAIAVDDLPQPPADVSQRFIPGLVNKIPAAVQADLRIKQPPGQFQYRAEQCALRAESPVIDGRIIRAAQTGDVVVLGRQFHLTTHTAIGANGFSGSVHGWEDRYSFVGWAYATINKYSKCSLIFVHSCVWRMARLSRGRGILTSIISPMTASGPLVIGEIIEVNIPRPRDKR